MYPVIWILEWLLSTLFDASLLELLSRASRGSFFWSARRWHPPCSLSTASGNSVDIDRKWAGIHHPL